jgi:hypothetical protein
MSDDSLAATPDALGKLHEDVLHLYSESARLNKLLDKCPYDLEKFVKLREDLEDRDTCYRESECDWHAVSSALGQVEKLSELAAIVAQRESLFIWFARVYQSQPLPMDEYVSGPGEGKYASYHETAFGIASCWLRKLTEYDVIEHTLNSDLEPETVRRVFTETEDSSDLTEWRFEEADHVKQGLRIEAARAANLCENAEPELVPPEPRVVVSTAPPQVTIDKKPYAITDDEAAALKCVMDANGDWIGGPKIKEATHIAKPDRVLRNLRTKLKSIDFIESQQGLGFRIREEWLA